MRTGDANLTSRGLAGLQPGGSREAATTGDILGRTRAGRRRAQPGGKWAWHYRMLLALRERLLRARHGQRELAAERLEPHSMNMADSATDEFDHALAADGLSAGQDALYEVDQAIRRILDGTYGRCEASGAAIPAARLRAIPWARFAKEVELSLEGAKNR